MHIAARPPENTYFQKEHDAIWNRSALWLKDLARQSQTTGLDLNVWISVWKTILTGRSIPGRNYL
jgi:hypothetical protein